MRSLISNRGSSTDDRRSIISGNSSNASTLVPESIASKTTATSQLRKFTAGVGRPGFARETREAVRNVISTQNPTRVGPLAMPLDYERFVSERSIQLENDPQRDLMIFPRDDIEEVKCDLIPTTAVPMVTKNDVDTPRWLLTQECLKLYTQPQRQIVFNYAKFAGDYTTVSHGSAMDHDVALSSLVFESDMALEEEKAAGEGFLLSDTVMAGYMMVVKSDPTLLDNLKSAKKRYCILRREEGGEIVVEVRKGPHDAPKRPPLRVNSAQLKATKKGKTVLEIEPCPSENEKDQQKQLTLASESMDELQQWLQNITRAIAFANKGDSVSVCSVGSEKKTYVPDPTGDNASIGSEDSVTSRDVALWRGRTTAARALQPPIVDRRNMFSLFYHLSPLNELKGEPSSVLPQNLLIQSPPASPVGKNGRRRVSYGKPGDKEIRFLIEFKGLDLKLPTGNNVMHQIEEFFVHMFLFDAQAGRRISEEFHIDASANDTEIKMEATREVQGVPRCLLIHRGARRVLCSLAGPDKDIWVVCRVDRHLSADTQGDLYMKSNVDPKAVQKLQKQIHGSLCRLTGFRQKFAWAARALFPELKGGDASTNSRKERGFMPLFRCENNRLADTDLLKYLGDFARVEKANKLVIPNAGITLRLDLSAKPSDFTHCLNPSLYPLNPWPALTNDDPPVFEMQRFGDTVAQPYSELVNLLYIYPLGLKYDSQKVFSKARNIACTVRYIRRGDPMGTKCIVDRLHPSGPFVSQATCGVQHHQQCPTFNDEIKVRLPLNLETNDHLLFSFTHVSVAGQNSVKSPESNEIPVGYVWFPLVWKKDRLVLETDEQEYSVAVAVDLPTGYHKSQNMGQSKTEENNEIRWVDQKPLFRFRLRIVSSVFTTESKIQTFFQACQRMDNRYSMGDTVTRAKSKSASPSGATASTTTTDEIRSCSPLAKFSPLNEHSSVQEVTKRVEALCEVRIEKLIPFLPVVLSRMFDLLPKAPTEQLAMSTLSSIVILADRVSDLSRKKLLRMFVRRHFMTASENDETTHSAICKYLPIKLREVQSSVDELSVMYRQLWLLLDCAAKSMAQTIVHEELFKNSRKSRFPSELLEQISGLVETIVSQLVAKHRELPEQCRAANTALAHFIRCCLSFTDRGAVFKWIHFAVCRLDEGDSRVLREYKADMLTVLSQHEHWLPLNLPVLLDNNNHILRVNYQSLQSETSTTANSGNNSGFLTRFFNQIFQAPVMSESHESDRYGTCTDEWFTSPSFASRHFLTGVLFQELCACLREPRDYRKRPIIMLRNLLAKHSYDRRYADVNMQRRIAILYAPLIRFAVDHVHELEAAMAETPDAAPTGLRAQAKMLNLDRHSKMLPEFALGGVQTSPLPKIPPLAEKLDQDEVQDLLISVLWVLHKLPRRILGAIWTEQDGVRSGTLIRLLELALNVFRYRGRENALAATSKDIRCTAKTLHLVPPSSSCRQSSVDLNGTSVSDTAENASEAKDCHPPLPFGVLQVLNMSQEVALVVLEASQTFSHQLATRRPKPLSKEDDHFCRLLSLHLSLLVDTWPEAVRLHAIAALALFVNLFRSRLFEDGPLDALSLLIERLLTQMASRLATVQSAAAALLQLILRNGYETAQNVIANEALTLSVVRNSSKQIRKLTAAERLGRPGAQTGVALARLLGVKSSLSSSGRFERGLTALEGLVMGDARKPSTVFDKAVLDLIRQLRGVMTATVALKEAANDSIRLAELQLHLADSYRGSSALRSAWFDTLAELHAGERWYAEAAVCHAHSVAIMARELKDNAGLVVDWSVLNWVSQEIVIVERSNVESETNVQPAGFTQENLLAKVEKTAQSLILAERFEAIGPLYRIIIPMLEKQNNFNLLVSVYAELQQTYSRAAEVKSSGKRHLGAYFRVRFHGKDHFDKDDGTEWIYHEPGLTSLADFSIRMRDTQMTVLGHDRVQVEPDAEVDSATLNPSVAYVYVTHVDPVVADGRTEKEFWTHTNINSFTYECPMLEGEKVAKEPAIWQQALKRVVIEVDGTFPSSLRRLRVLGKSEQVFSPLQFACQKLSIKAAQIREILAATSEGRPLDVKVLQLLLHGAVVATVNGGPLVYAEAFTQTEQRERYGEEGIRTLIAAFRDLISACEAGLSVNERAVGADQQSYHVMLTSSYEAILERLQDYFGQSFRVTAEEKKDETPQLPRTAVHILDSIGGVNA